MKVNTVGLSVSKSFHIDSYEKIILLIGNHRFKNYDIYLQFAYAWNGIIYRYKSIDYHDKRFSKSFSAFGNAPPHSQRLVQERELYNFFSNSYSIFENFAYALYFAIHHYNTNNFPVKSENDIYNINFHNIKCRLSDLYADEGITKTIISIISDDNYKTIKKYRNILSHRSAPGRQHYKFMNFGNQPVIWNEDIELTDKLTFNLKNWIFNKINYLLDESYIFIKELTK